ncbi:hypothetical protein [Mesorhizobium sp. KR9-304]|uniref:hypothetical protein n=1 Tax=Mesorhizobium sp. KR9-304 TaxID=3156614 RepID=UPI0032B3517D
MKDWGAAFSEFEQHVWHGQNSAALSTLLKILSSLSGSGGQLPKARDLQLSGAFSDLWREEAATRLSAAIAELLSRPDCQFDARTFQRLVVHHRWLHVIFNASSFGSSDFVLTRLAIQPSNDFIAKASMHGLFKMCLLYGAESSMPMDFSALFRRSPWLACSLAIGILSNRLLATPAAHVKREVLLRWITEALDKLDSPTGLPVEIFVDLWMHCSYGLERDKHDLKRPLNRLIRRQMKESGVPELEIVNGASRPTVFVMLEWFHKRHSIMRTHSISMRALRENYRLVGFGPKGMVDAEGKAVFDEFHEYGQYSTDLGFIRPILKQVAEQRPVAVYYPSVGMALHSLYLVNLRLAPTQIIALGHPATTHSDKIDYVLVEEDYIGDASLFSEKVVPVPKNALPYFRPSVRLPDADPKLRGSVRIAVPVAVMKLNPRFLEACRTIQNAARNEVTFHFMLGGAPDLVHSHAKKAIGLQVPGAVVHRTSEYPRYMANIAACDMFANPFPFGNTNGIVDTVFCGLPGICLTGDEVHSHIDEGMFRRMGFPDWTIASTVEEYIGAALRLIDESELRREWSDRIRRERPDEILYKGNPSAFSDVFKTLV